MRNWISSKYIPNADIKSSLDDGNNPKSPKWGNLVVKHDMRSSFRSGQWGRDKISTVGEMEIATSQREMVHTYAGTNSMVDGT